jgi:acyl transferase domain-containing protein/NADPH:quinone reductase-like Zn-dependent oxidoreductase/acyl carrier protein
MIRMQACAEPIAIVGIGCRFPGGANTWQDFWRLLDSGTDAISETPPERWSLKKFYAPQAAKPGKTQSRWGGYVSGIENFDPQLFGISPREAASMDPQQRMLLEVAFRALEDAGQPLERVAGQSVSVFVGISSFDYALAGLSSQDPGVIDAYSNTGGSSSIAANRISYCFDLRGPSVAVDTACSSSLVALHMACESLWRGEVPMALAGGVNALLMPDFYVAFSQLGVLSPDGRCKSFDARANGYVRSEGAGMVLLKPLATAVRDKDPIYAVIRGTALNQDGRTPGMTVPSQAAQEELIRAACRNAGVMPQEIQYVEAHGTGTPVGDPIEAAAIGAVIGRSRTGHQPCVIGSVKTNIGHLEAGAGIASLIKVSLALHHRRIPAHLHFQQANPAIDWDGLNLRIPRAAHDWQATGKRLAGINGFGYGGANAHIIVEQAPPGSRFATSGLTTNGLTANGTAHSYHRGRPLYTPRPLDTEPQQIRSSGLGTASTATESDFSAPVLLPISARTQHALSARLQQWIEWLEQHGEDYQLAEVAGFLAHRRSHHACRIAVTATNWVDMLSELRNLAASSAEVLAHDSSPAQLARGPVFVCSGQGPQWWGMGRGLLKYSATFRSLIKRCDTEFSKYGKWSLLKELMRSEHGSQMQRTSLAQPSIFAIQVALAAVWESWGVRPAAVVGHSVGEIAAAYLTGALSFEDAARVAFHRGRTMDLASSQGAMLAAGLAAHEVRQWLDGIETEVSIAAINGPSSVTISGGIQAIEVLAQRLEQAGVFCRRLAVEYAFHSPQMEPVREELLKSLVSIEPRSTHTQFISTVTGHALPGTELGAEYWWRNVRQSVRFSQAMNCLASQGYALAVEVGPHPVLAFAINECFQAAGCTVVSVPSLNRQQDDLHCITKSLGKLYSLGLDIQWSGFYNQPERQLEIPTYPFQSQRCWSESLESRMGRMTAEAHPLLGCPMLSPLPQWQQRIDLKLQTYLTAHRVRGAAVYPAAAILETALAAVRASNQDAQTQPALTALHLQRVRLHQPCVLGDNHPQWIQTNLDPQRRQLQLNFRPCDESQWSPLATLELSAQPTLALQAKLETQFADRVSQVRARCTDYFDAHRLYDHCRQIGLQYGQAFQGVVRGQRRAGEAILEIDLSLAELETADALDDYLLHPRLLDSCFHGMIAADPNFDHTVDGLYLPAQIEQVVWLRRPTRRLTAIVVCPYKSPQLMRCDLEIYDEAGRLCMLLRGFESRRVSGGKNVETTADLLYGYEWIEQPLQSPPTPQLSPGRHWIIFMDQAGVGSQLSAQLQARGDRVAEIYHDAYRDRQAFERSGRSIDPSSTAELQCVMEEAVEDLGQRVDGLVYLWGLDAPRAELLTADSLDESTLLTSLAPVRIVQAWEQWAGSSTASLKIVTSGAQAGDGQPEATEVAQAPLIGLGRVVASEITRLRTKLIDLSAELTDADIRSLMNELLTNDDEDEVRWREGRRWVHRFQPQAGKPVSADAARSLPCRLHVGQSAGIEELHYQLSPAPAPRAGEVEIAVVASGLNFSDVMKGLALYPGLPDGPVELGAECSGRISRVGPDSCWTVGDEVIAIAPGSFATHVIVNQDLVARKPRQLTHQQAAGLPIAFLTAHYALHECAGLRSGDSVLIHAASGGVGLAAMQLSRLVGARIFATAGSEEKRRVVREAGASLVMDSRSLLFGQQTLEATDGLGVDVVLNSLPSEAIPVGLSTLKPGGRFLEIGKRDIYNDSPLGLHPFRNNLAFFAIDLDQLFKQQPQRMGSLLRQLVERFERGELQPLPTHVFAADETTSAYRWMQQGKHVGKVVVDYQQRPSDVRAAELGPPTFDAVGTFWLAGGLGGFGLEVARWLAQRGVRSLVLSGRSVALSAVAQRVLDELRQDGVQITLLPCDITLASDVRQALDTIDEQLPPLRGIVHTAMVLEDKLLVDLDADTLQRVLRPKLLGGWNLHRETLGRELDYFILFSSLSSIFGHAGQANYSAANAALDSLAYYRRAQGLPATVINWGHLGEVGYLAQRAQLGERLERQGVLSFTVRQAMACLAYALQNKSVQMSVLRIDWSLWRGLGITQRVPPRFAHLLRSTLGGEQAALSDTLSAASLRGLPPERQSQAVESLLRVKTGGLLGIAPEKIPAERGLLEMGLDSLMAVELRNWLEGQLEINMPISSLMRSDSLQQLIAAICNLLADESHAAVPKVAQQASSTVSDAQAAELLAQLPELGEHEVQQLLSQMLREG